MKVGMIHHEGRLQRVWKLLEIENQVEVIDEETKDYDLLIFGLQKIVWSAFWERMNPNVIIICGYACEEVKKRFRVSCLLENEAFLIENAHHTAWGLLTIMMKESQNLLSDVQVDVIGYGRCGRAICELLKQLQIPFRIIVKDSKTGCDALYFEDYLYIQPNDFIICTAPVAFLDTYWVQRLKRKPIIFDITTENMATKLIENKDVQVIKTGSLPDQYLKHSAGTCYHQKILEMLI